LPPRPVLVNAGTLVNWFVNGGRQNQVSAVREVHTQRAQKWKTIFEQSDWASVIPLFAIKSYAMGVSCNVHNMFFDDRSSTLSYMTTQEPPIPMFLLLAGCWRTVRNAIDLLFVTNTISPLVYCTGWGRVSGLTLLPQSRLSSITVSVSLVAGAPPSVPTRLLANLGTRSWCLSTACTG